MIIEIQRRCKSDPRGEKFVLELVSQNTSFVQLQPSFLSLLLRRPAINRQPSRSTNNHHCNVPGTRRVPLCPANGDAARPQCDAATRACDPPTPATPVGSFMPLRSHAPWPSCPFWTPRPAPEFLACHAMFCSESFSKQGNVQSVDQYSFIESGVIAHL